ncbi:hypothetical protein E2C01_070682 [Portunus trituberculatus]|uniref:Uncharacterized protein n=1 Tax=Portunus trituberculatus TaxID=210409 RepID=A0A5B7I638_PORTR|nr:hypothetical protein [Portunus trituberculatus]
MSSSLVTMPHVMPRFAVDGLNIRRNQSSTRDHKKWAFHAKLWAKGDFFGGTSYLITHPLGNPCPERGSPTYTRTVDRIRTPALGDPSDPKECMVPQYHGCPLDHVNNSAPSSCPNISAPSS